MNRPKQMTFRFPEPELGFEELAITDCNRGVVAAIQRPEHWPRNIFCLIGQSRSGLTTLALAWAKRFDGNYINGSDGADLSLLPVDHRHASLVAIDRADLLKDKQHLLSLITQVSASDGRLLLTSASPPSQWLIQMPDLASRLRAAPLGELRDPDEAMMRIRLKKAAASLFINITPNVEEYLVTRLGLSYAALEDMIETISGGMSGRELTVPLVREILETWEPPKANTEI